MAKFGVSEIRNMRMTVTKFGMGMSDRLGRDMTPHAKIQIDRIRGGIPANG